jgi:hypothetical protein
VHHVVETEKLDREYMYRVASGIGRGERQRIASKGQWAYFQKLIEYLFKLGAAVVIGFYYVIKGQPAKFSALVNFRIDALKGLTGR